MYSNWLFASFIGTQAELAAMAYTAYRTGAPIQEDKVNKMLSAKQAYLGKLSLPGGIRIPDPLVVDDGWKGEDCGMVDWPNITHGDIVEYLNRRQGLDARETLNKYKEGKAFSFFSSNFVKEVLCKQLSDSICLLKTCVTRSTSLNEPPHRVWVCCSLESGQILRAYCTCTAG